MKKRKTVAVVTGDLINSSKLSETQKSLVKENLEKFSSYNPAVILPLQFYRGDSFQLMCTKEKAASIAVLIQAIIISSANTMARISIGIGGISRIDTEDVLQSEGEAFLLSGHQLDDMKSDNRLIMIAVNNKKVKSQLEITFLLAENIILDWKPGQASVISLNPKSEAQKSIAEQLNISPAAVSKTLKASKWPAIEQFLIWYEELITTSYE